MTTVKKKENSEDLLFKHFMLDMSLRQNDPLCALFDALDVIYDEYCKQGKKIKDIGLFLLGIKLKIDYFSIGKDSKPFYYELLRVIIGQWLLNDVGHPYIWFDEACYFSGQKVALPIPDFGLIKIAHEDVEKAASILADRSMVYSENFALLRVKGLYFVEVCFKKREGKLFSSRPKKNMSLKKNLIFIGDQVSEAVDPESNIKTSATDPVEDYKKYLVKFQGAPIVDRKTNKTKKSNSVKNSDIIRFESVTSEPKKKKKKKKISLSIYVSSEQDYNKYLDRFSDKKSIDVESVSEVLESFREIDQKGGLKIEVQQRL
jgi:hypothetical protein